MVKLRITRRYAEKFDKKCAIADSHGFLKFLTKPNSNNISLLNLIADIEDSIQFKPNKRDRDIKLDEKTIANYMCEFFSIYMPQKREEVEQILNKTHPYFIDEKGKSHINFIHAKKGDEHSSNVGHHEKHSFLEFNVYIHNSLDDLRTTAHEISHALSSHHQHKIKMLRANEPKQEHDKNTQKRFEKDCVGEIESHITERLFNKFLVEKGLYSQEDLANYEQLQKNSLISEINLIREERDIIQNLPCPVNQESLKNLVNHLQKENCDRLVSRVGKMHDEKKYSSYMFRYVVGRIVSEQWMRNFDNASDKQTQLKILDKFQTYLGKTHELDLDSACEDLLGQDFAGVVKEYIAQNQKENGQLQEKKDNEQTK